MDAPTPTTPFFFETYVHETTDLRHFLDFAWFGVERATHHADFEETFLFPRLKEYVKGNDPEPFKALLPSDGVRSFITTQSAEGFPFLHQLSVARLWSILETVVDDAVAHVLRRSPPTELPAAVRSIRAPIFEYLAADEESQATFLLDCVKQDIRSSLKVGVGRFESLLSAVGYGGEVDDLVRRALLELSEVRNVVVHRAGKADERIVERCPWMTLSKGSRLQLTRRDFSRYVAASDWYAFELLHRLMHTVEDSPTPADKLQKHRDTLTSRKAAFLDPLRMLAKNEA
jgi:hypothetical protein